MLLYALQMSFARFFVTRARSTETARSSCVTSIQVKFELYRGHKAIEQGRKGSFAKACHDPPKVAYAIPEVTRDLY